MSSPGIEGSVILVTGGGSGIGAATVQWALDRGARVFVADKSTDSLATLPKDDWMQAVQADVSAEEDMERTFEACRDHFGRLDGIVANAGISLGGTAETTSVEDWDYVLATNLRSVYLAGRFGIPLLRQSGGGSFVAVASQLGLVGAPNSAAYCASKGGVITLVKAMALDYAADSIRVNSVCPGPTHTPMFDEASTEEHRAAVTGRVPLGRIGFADEIASVIGFLLSAASSYVTGATWTVDGGYTTI